jgi:putative ABC transport system permease protein
MIFSYLKIAFRNILRNKFFSLINILGLSIGLTCCIYIYKYVEFEFSYDKHYKDFEQIYRIALTKFSVADTRVTTLTSATMAPVLKEKYPQVEFAARLRRSGNTLVEHNSNTYYEDRCFLTDSDLFQVFGIHFYKGDPQTALDESNSVVITQNMAKKYFGNDDAFGQIIKINSQDYEITGIIENPILNSHFKYNLFRSLKLMENHPYMSMWDASICYTYIKMHQKSDVDAFEKQIEKIADNYIKKILEDSGTTFTYFLQPLADIHLLSDLLWELETPGSMLHIYIFSAIGIFILLIACINYMNLSTARSVQRIKEISLRKIVGAKRVQILVQFFGESFIFTLIALTFSLTLVELFSPFFNNLAGVEISLDYTNPKFIFELIFITIFTGFVSGIYPAMYLSSLKQLGAKSKTAKTFSGNSMFRKSLVIFQFSISIIVICSTLIVNQQIEYMKNKNLGFEKQGKIIIPIMGGISISNNFETLKEDFGKFKTITGITASSSVPGRIINNYEVFVPEQTEKMNQLMDHLLIDFDFIPEYKINILAGRAFDREMSSDTGRFIINKAAVQALGWNSPQESIGKEIFAGITNHKSEVIGVVEDFHCRGLQNIMEPMILEIFPRRFRFLSVSTEIADISETLNFLKTKWEELYPQNPFEYFMLDTDFEQQYSSEKKVSEILGVFTPIALIIACLGLFGLAAFLSEQRTKEIGIRKVLGSKAIQITLLLSKDFTKWVFIAFLIANPITYFSMKYWLQNFAYRTTISLNNFILTGAIALFIALATVSWQAIKTSAKNPVDSLRHE